MKFDNLMKYVGYSIREDNSYDKRITKSVVSSINTYLNREDKIRLKIALMELLKLHHREAVTLDLSCSRYTWKSEWSVELKDRSHRNPHIFKDEYPHLKPFGYLKVVKSTGHLGSIRFRMSSDVLESLINGVNIAEKVVVP